MAYKELRLDVSISAEESDLLQFVIYNDLMRIARDNPDALKNSESYAGRIKALHNKFVEINANNRTA